MQAISSNLHGLNIPLEPLEKPLVSPTDSPVEAANDSNTELPLASAHYSKEDWKYYLHSTLISFTNLPTDNNRDALWDGLRQYQQSHRGGNIKRPPHYKKLHEKEFLLESN